MYSGRAFSSLFYIAFFNCTKILNKEQSFLCRSKKEKLVKDSPRILHLQEIGRGNMPGMSALSGSIENYISKMVPSKNESL